MYIYMYIYVYIYTYIYIYNDIIVSYRCIYHQPQLYNLLISQSTYLVNWGNTLFPESRLPETSGESAFFLSNMP